MLDLKQKYFRILCGSILGAMLSIILILNDSNDVVFYFTLAPYFIESVVSRIGLSSLIIFIYFISFFAFLGHILTGKFSVKKIIIIIGLISVHFVLMYFGSRSIFKKLPEALRHAVPADLFEHTP